MNEGKHGHPIFDAASLGCRMPGDPSETEAGGHIDGLLMLVEPGAALIDAVDDPADPCAETLLRSVYRGRRIVMLPIGAIAVGGGGFHRDAQRQPAAGSAP